MRIKDFGSIVRVCVSAREVSNFADRWPCSGLPDKAIAFDFEKRNGDLVDVSPSGIDGEALLNLSYDAWAFYNVACDPFAKHQKRIAAQNANMPAALRNVMSPPRE